MKIIKQNVASIANNDPEEVDRVSLSIACDADEASYFIITDIGEDCGPHFKTQDDAEGAIYKLWGRSAAWDLQYN